MAFDLLELLEAKVALLELLPFLFLGLLALQLCLYLLSPLSRQRQ